MASSGITEEVPPGTSSDADVMGNEGNDNLKRDNEIMQPVQDQTNSIMSDPSPPTFSVSQALDALTGVDDSTQVAVNSVFGVLENMIAQVEEGSDDENGDKDRKGIKEKKIDSGSDQHSIIDDHKLDKEENKNTQSIRSDNLDDPFVYNHHEISIHSQHDTRTGKVEEETTQNLNSSNGKSMDRSQGSKINIHVAQYQNEKKDQLVGSKHFFADNPDKLRHVNSIPLHVTANPFGTSLYNEYLRIVVIIHMVV